MTSEYRHIPVLLPECMKYLKLSEGKTYVDATLGGAGHSLEAAKLIGPTGHLLGIDQDDVARAAASERLAALPDDVRPEVDVLAGNFGELDSLLVSAQIPSIDAILFDIGVSSVQIDTPSRGFSFKETGPLDMRMDQRQEKTARDIVEVRKLKANLVSVNIDKLVNEGYLIRKNVEGDRRKVQLLCTDKAQPIISRGQQLQEHFVEQLFTDIDDATRQTIFQGMQQMELNLNFILEDN